jgi:uncharacterized protein YjbI with pentapeptide repeats
MAHPEHLAKLKDGVEKWNQWRKEHFTVIPDLRDASLKGVDLRNAYLYRVDLGAADLSEAKLSRANLRRANLGKARLSRATLERSNLTMACFDEADLGEANLTDSAVQEAHFTRANLAGASLNRADLRSTSFVAADLSKAALREANLRKADLQEAILWKADLRRADLFGANLRQVNLCSAKLGEASLREANLSGADLSGAGLEGALLLKTNMSAAKLSGCFVYGISAWGVELTAAIQSDLVITPYYEATIQVDNLEVAQFIYLLLNNEKIRHVIDTITSKVVLILGRFSDERKAVLEAIREELRKRDYLPVLFDFEKPSSRNLTETIRTLAHLARFVIADITDAKSIPQELMAIVPNLPSLPVQPLLLASQHKYGMFDDFRDFPWVLKEFVYKDQATLLVQLEKKVIGPAERRASSRVAKARAQAAREGKRVKSPSVRE